VSQAAKLAPALTQALSHDGVSVVDVLVDAAVPLLYARKD
jgi:benzoylformate decarboxylase